MAQLNIRAARGWVLRALAIAAIPVILVFVFLLVAREFQRSEDLTGQLAASHNARAQIAQLLAVHQDIEIGQRSWILTGNDEFREPYEAARPKLEPTLDSIVGLLGRSPEAVRLEELSAAKLEFVERTLALARAGRRDEAIALIRAGEGKEMMDGIRSTIADIRIA
jgi:CHASE3 domain sensor protein